ncbi:MAG: hypothetical protein UY63_C0004G0016 [Parcubacteria group bacterium GW2011_GWA2_51_10]|nr:MAG: hypothetical protein UY63_C0004G0016 [Parcubacteria group bacterium GW2011_GWA2_51_10]
MSEVQSSFIPPDTVTPSGKRRESGGGLSDFLSLVGLVLVVASVVLAIGVFLYQQFLDESKESRLKQLKHAKEQFQPTLILEMTRLDDRMEAAETILANHPAPSTFFHMLEQVTLSTVSFRSLAFEVVDAQTITIKMDGIAKSVNAVALQADLFSKNGVITSPIFSNIDRQQDGVHFSLTANINPAAIRYRQLIADLIAAAQNAPGEATEELPASSAAPFSPSQQEDSRATGPGDQQ